MRMPKYLSPTSIQLWYKDREEFFRKYLAENRQPRMPQTEPMSVGSAFDAYIKNYLASCLGMEEAKGELELEKLLIEQVEPQNHDFAFEAGRKCFEAYKSLGATGYLMKELEGAAEKPCFEYTVQATLTDTETSMGVPLLGKPDLYFYTKSGKLCIYDWKVNGYCSKSGASPKKGHLRCLTSGKPSSAHKLVTPMVVDGISIDIANPLHAMDESWATQLAIYGWVLGGLDAKIIAGIDQLACGPKGIRVASMRNKLDPAWLAELWCKCVEIWSAIQEGAIFAENNEQKQLELEDEAGAFVEDGDDNEKWYTSIMRSHKW